jgi:hypothetical protein
MEGSWWAVIKNVIISDDGGVGRPVTGDRFCVRVSTGWIDEDDKPPTGAATRTAGIKSHGAGNCCAFKSIFHSDTDCMPLTGHFITRSATESSELELLGSLLNKNFKSFSCRLTGQFLNGFLIIWFFSLFLFYNALILLDAFVPLTPFIFSILLLLALGGRRTKNLNKIHKLIRFASSLQPSTVHQSNNEPCEYIHSSCLTSIFFTLVPFPFSICCISRCSRVSRNTTGQAITKKLLSPFFCFICSFCFSKQQKHKKRNSHVLCFAMHVHWP